MLDNVIEINNLSLSYAFQNFSISFERNKLIVVTGANNCGKTTLIRSIVGQIFTDNTIYIFSQELEYYRITELNTILKYIISQEYTFTKESVFAELLYSLNNLDIEYSIKEKKIKQILQDFNMLKFQNTSPTSLTDTLKVKLQLAKHLLQTPKILLLDDIFLNMSKEEATNIISVLKKFQEKMDLTIIITTSNLEMALQSDYIYVIDNNTIALEGPPLGVLQKDNILNRLGLELPFIVDLSVKLRDYDLISDISMNIDIEGMVSLLWK